MSIKGNNKHSQLIINVNTVIMKILELSKNYYNIKYSNNMLKSTVELYYYILVLCLFFAYQFMAKSTYLGFTSS